MVTQAMSISPAWIPAGTARLCGVPANAVVATSVVGMTQPITVTARMADAVTRASVQADGERTRGDAERNPDRH